MALRPLATAASNGSLAATMVRPAQPAPAAQPSQLPQTGSLTKPSETAELLMTKEELLKELLEPRPGKIPPKVRAGRAGRSAGAAELMCIQLPA